MIQRKALNILPRDIPAVGVSGNDGPSNVLMGRCHLQLFPWEIFPFWLNGLKAGCVGVGER